MALKDRLLSQGMKLMQDPRVMKLMQDPRVMKTLMQAFELRGKVQESFEERVARIAKSLNLVTKKEVRQLERTLRKLERELEAARAEAARKDEPKTP
jgi:polyhydroxyalkanoate synthesis regulator phasin